MSKIPFLRYLIQREGEGGKIGNIRDAIQLKVGSPIVRILKKRGYYEGSKQEWEEFTGLVAGDMDGDGDYDAADKKIIRDL